MQGAPLHSLFRAFACFVIGTCASGCSGYADHTKEARSALDAGQPATARELYNKALRVKTAKDLPSNSSGDRPLLVLERAAISLSLDDHESSARDLQYADKEIEMLDLSRTAVEGIGKYIFSDDSGGYRSAPYEKVMVNTLNIVNYLARHDLNGARIEARRMSILQKYLRETENPAEEINAPGGYLAGFVFERSGRPDIALRYYDEALAYADFASLVEPIQRLSRRSGYSTARLRAFLKKHRRSDAEPSPSTPPKSVSKPESVPGPHPRMPQPPQALLPNGTPRTGKPLRTRETSPPRGRLPSRTNNQASPPTNVATSGKETPRDNAQQMDPNQPGDLLIVINFGRVPAKKSKRIPIGLALTYATAHMTGPGMTGANRLAAQGLVSWINYPELERRRRVGTPDAQLNGKRFQLESGVALDVATKRAYDNEKGKIIASAITRLVARIVAGEATGAAVGAASDNPLIGALASLATQATLTAADTPDTRSWSTLPARMAFGRARLTPGKHQVTLRVHGKEKSVPVEMTPGGWKTVVLTVLR